MDILALLIFPADAQEQALLCGRRLRYRQEQACHETG
jgi:hypothetical protein